MSSYGMKLPDPEIFRSDPKLWESKLRCYLPVLDIFKFVTEVKDDAHDIWVDDQATDDNKESYKK